MYYAKAIKETNRDESDRLYDLYHLYRKFEQRCLDLSIPLLFPHKFGDEIFFKDFENKSILSFRKNEKEKRRIKFETLHRISVWFSHTSLNADYGKFTCEKCGYTFYHSPSGVSLGKIKQYVCICGECVNAILRQDGIKEIFE
jgi:hypothetical protein